ncbi:MAG: hypothetical protein CMO01_30685 [Thalassobius sp.]|nr:hypothetical protein [Thalassovita sp.]
MQGKDEALLYKLKNADATELLSARYVAQKFPKHYHETYCIGILEEGAEVLSFGENDLVVTANSIIAINPYDVHENYALDRFGWKYKMMYINSDLMGYAAACLGNRFAAKINFEQAVFEDAAIFNSISQLYKQVENKQELITETLLIKTLQKLIVSYGKSTKPDFEPDKNTQEIKAFLDVSFEAKFELDKLAQQFKTDKYKLIRQFKKHTGLTPLSYVLLQRTNKAKTLIAQGESISQTALETGFYDQSHFDRYFKKYVGVTPVSYQKTCNILQD